MNFVQIIYEDAVSNGEQEKSDLAPVLLDNSYEEKDLEPTISKTNLVTSAEEAASASQEKIKNLTLGEWTSRETNFLLKRYNKYITMTGARKQFRTKRDMWCRVAADMKTELKILRSPGQCENRYKTVLRKWRKQNPIKNFPKNEPGPSRPSDQNNIDESCDELPVNNHEQVESDEKGLAKVLWDIFKKKEEGRERRHREKIEVIKKIMKELIE